jgi:adenylosuccinate lyase
MGKIAPNPTKLASDLEANWAVLAEGIQTILRAAGVHNPYELLKDLTRGQQHVTRETLHAFIGRLDVDDSIKERLLALTPETYIGLADRT